MQPLNFFPLTRRNTNIFPIYLATSCNSFISSGDSVSSNKAAAFVLPADPASSLINTRAQINQPRRSKARCGGHSADNVPFVRFDRVTFHIRANSTNMSLFVGTISVSMLTGSTAVLCSPLRRRHCCASKRPLIHYPHPAGSITRTLSDCNTEHAVRVRASMKGY